MAQWPGITDFQAAAMKATNFCDSQLASGEIIKNKHGLPASWSGGFAIVYKVRVVKSFWAARVFQYKTDYLKSYQLISQTIANLPAQSPAKQYFVNFEYQEQGIKVPAFAKSPLNPFPIVKMQWIDALTLDKWIEKNLNNPRELISVAEQWKRMVYGLCNENIAHGDLQQGNVLVTDTGDLKLIDYDGMYVPAMKNTPGQILGHKSWIHPKKGPKDFGDLADQFPGLVGYISLQVLATDKSLWKYYNGQNLIFTESDLRDVTKSRIYADLAQMTKPINGARPVADLVNALAHWSGSVATATTLWDALGDPDPRVHTGKTVRQPPPKYVEIIIVTDPPGSVVRINDISYGQTDDASGELRVNVEPKHAVIKVERQGRDSITKAFDLGTVRPGAKLPFTLGASGPAQSIVIRTDPLGADVYIGGNFYGSVPPGGLHIPVSHFAGRRERVEMMKDGYQKCAEFIDFGNPSKQEYHFSLRREMASGTVGYWLLSSATALVIGLLCLNQLAGPILFPKYWGFFAFFSGALAMGLNKVFPNMYRLLGGSLLAGAAILAVALGPPEILHNVQNFSPALFSRQSLVLLFCVRYVGFVPGVILGWLLAKGRWRRHLSSASSVLLVWGVGVILPFAVPYFEPRFLLYTSGGIGWVCSMVTGLLIGAASGVALSALPQKFDPACCSSKTTQGLVIGGLIGYILVGGALAFMAPPPPALTVFTSPGDVVVYSDGTKLGVTDRQGHLSIPFTLSGRYTLTFKKEDFGPESRGVMVSNDSTVKPLRVDLRRTHSHLEFFTSTPQCEVLIEGCSPHLSGKNGFFRSPPLPVGSRAKIKITKPNYMPLEYSIERIPAEERIDLGKLELKRATTGKLSLSGAAPEATVSINGQEYGKTDRHGDAEFKNMPLGIPLSVKIDKKGWCPKSLDVQDLTEQRPSVAKNVEMERRYAILKVITKPEKVKIIVNGEEKGETKSDYELLVPRIALEEVLNIEFKKKGYETVSKEILLHDTPTLPDGRTVDLGPIALRRNVTIISRPAAVGIYLDGIKIADTGPDARVQVPIIPRNDLDLLIKKPGYHNQTIRIVDSINTDYTVELEAILTSVDLSTTPTNVDVSIDGKFVANTGEKGLRNLPGIRCGVPLKFAFSKTEYLAKELVVTIPTEYEGKTYKLEPISLTEKPVSVRFKTEPGQVLVLANGIQIGISNERGELATELPKGEYRVEFRKPGCFARSETIDFLPPGRTVQAVLKDSCKEMIRAAESGDVEMMKECLRNGASTECRDSQYGGTPLHWACANGRTKGATFLIENGSRLNLKNNKGLTALMWAAMKGDSAIVRKLLENGADCEITDNDGMTALDRTPRERKSQEILELLRRCQFPTMNITPRPLNPPIRRPGLIQDRPYIPSSQ